MVDFQSTWTTTKSLNLWIFSQNSVWRLKFDAKPDPLLQLLIVLSGVNDSNLWNTEFSVKSAPKKGKWWIFSQKSVFSAVIQRKRLGRFDSNFAHTLLWVFHTWQEPVRMCLYSLQAYLSVKSSHLNDYEHFHWNRQRSLALETEYW